MDILQVYTSAPLLSSVGPEKTVVMINVLSVRTLNRIQIIELKGRMHSPC